MLKVVSICYLLSSLLSHVRCLTASPTRREVGVRHPEMAVADVPDRAAERRPAQAAADEDEDEGLGWCGTAVCGGFALGAILLIGYLLTRNAEPYRKLKVESFANDEVLRTVVWPQATTIGSARGGPNGPDVDWAIFFYKPYCGACR